MAVTLLATRVLLLCCRRGRRYRYGAARPSGSVRVGLVVIVVVVVVVVAEKANASQ